MLINELHLSESDTYYLLLQKDLAYEAIQHGVADYILTTYRFYKVNLKVEKSD
jgi:hypothetical protein